MGVIPLAGALCILPRLVHVSRANNLGHRVGRAIDEAYVGSRAFIRHRFYHLLWYEVNVQPGRIGPQRSEVGIKVVTIVVSVKVDQVRPLDRDTIVIGTMDQRFLRCDVPSFRLDEEDVRASTRIAGRDGRFANCHRVRDDVFAWPYVHAFQDIFQEGENYSVVWSIDAFRRVIFMGVDRFLMWEVSFLFRVYRVTNRRNVFVREARVPSYPAYPGRP